MQNEQVHSNVQTFDLKGQELILHPFKAAFWVEERALIIADLHLGKNQHFRKNGIAVPQEVSNQNFQRLQQLIDLFDPAEILILGDLFHSSYNQVWERINSFVLEHPHIPFNLIPGNHDILEQETYEKSPIHYLNPVEERGPFVLSHHRIDDLPPELYNISGHVHPGVRMYGSGRQSVRLSCFYFKKQHGILPAFGAFTGLGIVSPSEEDHVFGIVEGKVMRL